jgi:phosphonate transport system substrate-binding protein
MGEPLRILTFLAPNMEPVYRGIVDHLAAKLGYKMELRMGVHYEEAKHADLCFICGLPYVLRTPPYREPGLLEALAAPVLKGERFGRRPIYYSDVVVSTDSPYSSFGELRGKAWAYNEPESQSGYGITRYHLVRMGETAGFFGRVIEAGFHQKAMRMVAAGKVDATAIDCQVLAIECRDHADLASRLKVIDTLGPSTIQPLAANVNLPPALKADIQAALIEMHGEPAIRALFDYGYIERFATVNDADYNDIRAMVGACEQAGFMTLV